MAILGMRQSVNYVGNPGTNTTASAMALATAVVGTGGVLTLAFQLYHDCTFELFDNNSNNTWTLVNSQAVHNDTNGYILRHYECLGPTPGTQVVGVKITAAPTTANLSSVVVESSGTIFVRGETTKGSSVIQALPGNVTLSTFSLSGPALLLGSFANSGGAGPYHLGAIAGSGFHIDAVADYGGSGPGSATDYPNSAIYSGVAVEAGTFSSSTPVGFSITESGMYAAIGVYYVPQVNPVSATLTADLSTVKFVVDSGALPASDVIGFSVQSGGSAFTTGTASADGSVFSIPTTLPIDALNLSLSLVYPFASTEHGFAAIAMIDSDLIDGARFDQMIEDGGSITVGVYAQHIADYLASNGTNSISSVSYLIECGTVSSSGTVTSNGLSPQVNASPYDASQYPRGKLVALGVAGDYPSNTVATLTLTANPILGIAGTLTRTFRPNFTVTDFYVAGPDGNDTNNGTTTGTPVATIEKAFELIGTTADVTIHLRHAMPLNSGSESAYAFYANNGYSFSDRSTIRSWVSVVCDGTLSNADTAVTMVNARTGWGNVLIQGPFVNVWGAEEGLSGFWVQNTLGTASNGGMSNATVLGVDNPPNGVIIHNSRMSQSPGYNWGGTHYLGAEVDNAANHLTGFPTLAVNSYLHDSLQTNEAQHNDIVFANNGLDTTSHMFLNVRLARNGMNGGISTSNTLFFAGDISEYLTIDQYSDDATTGSVQNISIGAQSSSTVPYLVVNHCILCELQSDGQLIVNDEDTTGFMTWNNSLVINSTVGTYASGKNSGKIWWKDNTGTSDYMPADSPPNAWGLANMTQSITQPIHSGSCNSDGTSVTATIPDGATVNTSAAWSVTSLVGTSSSTLTASVVNFDGTYLSMSLDSPILQNAFASLNVPAGGFTDSFATPSVAMSLNLTNNSTASGGSGPSITITTDMDTGEILNAILVALGGTAQNGAEHAMLLSAISVQLGLSSLGFSATWGDYLNQWIEAAGGTRHEDWDQAELVRYLVTLLGGTPSDYGAEFGVLLGELGEVIGGLL